MKRMWSRGVLGAVVSTAAVVLLLAPVPAHAQISRVSSTDHRQAIGVNLGGFFLKGADSRVNDDVLLADLDSLVFDVKDFNGGSFGGEWLVGIGQYLEAGVGAGVYQRTVPSIYRSVVNKNGSEIEQDLKLRVVPVTATLRFLPIGRGGAVEPYVGAGIGAFKWRYSEIGEFVDFDEGGTIFPARYVAKGTAVGPVILAGLRAPFGDIWDIGGEVRWQKAEGDIKRETGLLGDKIDLGGWNAGVTLHLRF